MVIRIVDDDEELLTSFRFLLEGEGWFVRTYNSAESFLEKDNFNVPGCAIVDIRMTGMSGLELQDVLNARGIKLPLIFQSGHGTVETVVDTLKSGAVTFLSKPPSLDKLKEAIENALKHAKEIDEQKEDFRNWQSLTSKEKRGRSLSQRRSAEQTNCGRTRHCRKNRSNASNHGLSKIRCEEQHRGLQNSE